MFLVHRFAVVTEDSWRLRGYGLHELLDSICGAFHIRGHIRCTTCHGPKTVYDQSLVAGSVIVTALTDDLEDRCIDYICRSLTATVRCMRHQLIRNLEADTGRH